MYENAFFQMKLPMNRFINSKTNRLLLGAQTETFQSISSKMNGVAQKYLNYRIQKIFSKNVFIYLDKLNISIDTDR